MNRRVWTLVFVLSISSLFTVRSAFPQGQTPSQRRAIAPPAKPTDSPVSLGMLVGANRIYQLGMHSSVRMADLAIFDYHRL